MPSSESSSEASPKAGSKSWRVLHACEKTSTVSDLTDAETKIGMTPQVLARESWKSDPNGLSLLTTWNDVRDWRHALNDAEAVNSFQIVHAHSFASAMAGVRGSLPLVYDFAYALGEVTPEQSHSGPWLLRSFRVAEQFALTRASAVVVHSKTMATIAHDRGAAPPNIFRIHHPFISRKMENDQSWYEAHGIDPSRDFVVLVLGSSNGHEFSLKTLATLKRDLPNVVLVLECDQATQEVMQRASELNLGSSLRCVSPHARDSAIASADLVLAFPTEDPSGRSNEGMLSAMSASKPVVAADAPENRECSEDGEGCLWFQHGEVSDLTRSVLSLATNQYFRSELGKAGRDHLLATRAPEVVGRAYNEVYRHAQSRRTETIQLLPAPKIYALGPG